MKHALTPSLFFIASLATACAHQSPAPAPEAAAPATASAAGTASAAATTATALPIEAAGKLHGYHVKLKCGAAQDARSCKLSSDQERSRLDVVLAGDPATTYDVKLRVRGLVEPRRYTGGALADPSNKWFYAGGQADPSKKNNGQAYNVYQLVISQPAQHYFLNRDTDDALGGGYNRATPPSKSTTSSPSKPKGAPLCPS